MSRRQLAETVRSLDVVGPVSRALAQCPLSSNPVSKSVTPDDSIFFDLFRHATVVSTCGIFPSSFWSETVMQLAHNEPAIWHAILAIGALHRRKNLLEGNTGGLDEQSLARRAETHYGKALGLAQDLTDELKVATLATILVSAACLLGRWPEMHKHLMAGLKIVSSKQDPAPSLRVVGSTLMKLDLQAMTFSESSSPYPYEMTVIAFPVAKFLALPLIQGVSYEELIAEMFGLLRTYMILDDDYLQGGVAYGPWLTTQNSFLRRLIHWENRMASFESTHPPRPSDEATRLCIRLWHVTARTLIRATPIGGETRFDSLLGHFEYGIKIALAVSESMRGSRMSSLSLEPGLVAPLWSVIHRCRHRLLRRAALAILENTSRTEAMWSSRMAAPTIKALVDVEEEYLDPIESSDHISTILGSPSLTIPWNVWSKPDLHIPTTLTWDDMPVIPEDCRVKDVLGLMGVNQSRIDVRLLMSTDPTLNPLKPGLVREMAVDF
jgi:cholestenol delta-isomerase